MLIHCPFSLWGRKMRVAKERVVSIIDYVTHVDDDVIILNGNHPSTGRNATSYIKFSAIYDAAAEELASGEYAKTPGWVH